MFGLILVLIVAMVFKEWRIITATVMLYLLIHWLKS